VRVRIRAAQSPLGVSTFSGKTVKRVISIPNKNNANLIIMNFVV